MARARPAASRRAAHRNLALRAAGEGKDGGQSQMPKSSPVEVGNPRMTDTQRRREVRGNRAVAQWVAAEKKGRIKVVVAASELEFELARGVLLEPPSSEKDLIAAFENFDTDGSGAIDKEELERGMQAMGVDPQPQNIQSLMEDADIDGSGEIDLDEFRLTGWALHGSSGVCCCFYFKQFCSLYQERK